ncbi:peptidylprolyl isomerase [Cellvibrio polysaccharolyticus]|uniref:peptidylprolyl isomerase n=1 Tax=Cellvibrio polysaccharolyticus TaxID=2082724 RepID=A0A928YVT0_9GAMM|nr:peptidylprolyl isomerase [Cellvibrio polysaccharolyticus]MBE8718875.1 hypothetical protein [Cellvibrio polysaccharolyticus]
MYRKILSVYLFSVVAGASFAQAQSDDVVVAVDDIRITTDDVRHYMEERLASGVSPDAFASSKGITQSVENILSLRRLGKMARDAGFVSSEQIEWEVALYRERLQYREWVKSLVDKEISSTSWDAAAREEYIANSEKYFIGSDQVRVSHILIGTDDRSSEEAKSLAEKVLKEVKKSGSDFEALVEQYSNDPSAETNKGDLGFFGKGQMVPAFEAAAFDLSKAKPVSDLVETEFGFHIIKFIDKRAPRKLTFDEAKKQIIPELQSKVPSTIRSRLTMEARSVSADAAVINEEALKKLEKKLLEQ